MQFLQNPESVRSKSLVLAIVLILVPICSSSQEKVMRSIDIVDPSSNNDFTHQKLNPKLLYQIKVHGFLLWASMGLLMPIGILSIRMSNYKDQQCGRNLKLFYLHLTSQMGGVILATIAAIMSIRNFNNSFNNYHQRIGIGLYALIWLQALLGFLRPSRECKARGKWFLGHWLLGTSVAVLGITNIYTGLHAYHQKSSTSTKLWTILFTIQISFIAFFYLFQEKWAYILRQGTVLTDESSSSNLAHNNRVSVIDEELNETTVVPQK